MPIERVTGLLVTVERDVEAKMRNGTVLRSDVYRSDSAAEHLVLLMRCPYDKRSGTPTFGIVHAAWWATQRYVMVVQDSRGRFASDGDFYPCQRQMDDGYDSVQWAAHLPGSDGQGAMTRFSCVGTTRLLAAVMRPPSLWAIAPAFIASRTSTDGRKAVVPSPSPNIGQCARHRHGSTPRRRADGAPAFGNARQRARLGLGASGLRVPTAAQRRCLSDVLRRFDGSGKVSPAPPCR